jgi:hypothetical protein
MPDVMIGTSSGTRFLRFHILMDISSAGQIWIGTYKDGSSMRKKIIIKTTTILFKTIFQNP